MRRWKSWISGLAYEYGTRITDAGTALNIYRGPGQPSIVETSPASTPASFAFRNRRRIFPDRVLGNDATNSSEEGVAIGPSSLRTCSISAAASASDAT